MIMQQTFLLVIFACLSSNVQCSGDSSPRGTNSPRGSIGSGSDKGSGGVSTIAATAGSSSTTLSISPRAFSAPNSQPPSPNSSPRGPILNAAGAGTPRSGSTPVKERLTRLLNRKPSAGSLSSSPKKTTVEEFIAQLEGSDTIRTAMELLLLKLSTQELGSTTLNLDDLLTNQAELIKEIINLQQPDNPSNDDILITRRLELVALQAKLIAAQQLKRLQQSSSTPAIASTSSTLDSVTGE